MDAIWSKHAHLVLKEELGLCWELSSSSRLEQDILLELLLESLMVLLKSLLECLQFLWSKCSQVRQRWDLPHCSHRKLILQKQLLSLSSQTHQLQRTDTHTHKYILY